MWPVVRATGGPRERAVLRRGRPPSDPSLAREADHVTVSAVIMDLKAGEMRLTEGNPCEAPFEAHRLEDLLPPAAPP